jgi:hypothetical protein
MNLTKHTIKMKNITMIAVLAFLLASGTVSAQNETSTYKTALGVKIWGDGGGISLKSFVNNNNALEGIGYFWRDGFRLTGLYEFHFDFEGAPGLKWYVGPGAHIGFYNNGPYYDNNGNPSNSRSYVGINMSIDWQPSFEFGDNRGFVGNWGGLGIRYTF